MANAGKSTGFPLETIEFARVCEPGAYYVFETGQLLRVPEDGLSPGRGPLVSFSSTEPVLVYSVSHDPWVPIGKAREVVRELGQPVRF